MQHIFFYCRKFLNVGFQILFLKSQIQLYVIVIELELETMIGDLKLIYENKLILAILFKIYMIF